MENDITWSFTITITWALYNDVNQDDDEDVEDGERDAEFGMPYFTRSHICHFISFKKYM